MLSWQNEPGDFGPGDTVVLPSSNGAWNVFGFKPENCPADRGDEARLLLKRRICLRLHPSILNEWPPCLSREELARLVMDDRTEEGDLRKMLCAYPEQHRPRGLKEMWTVLFPGLPAFTLSREPGLDSRGLLPVQPNPSGRPSFFWKNI